MWSACLLVALLVAHGPSAAQSPAAATESEPAVPEKAGKDLHAYRIRGASPRLDGVLDDDVWKLAQAIDDFVQNEPDNMAPPRGRTVVQAAYDERTLYVAVRCFMKDASQIGAGLGRRDSPPPSDRIMVGLDPRHDHQNGFIFEANPSGVQSDYMFVDDTRMNRDFDAVWEVRTRIAHDGWYAEYAIPFSQLRFTVRPGEKVVWGLNVRRDYLKAGGFDLWVPIPRGAAGQVSRFGHLIFDEPLSPPRRIELLPVVLGRREMAPTSAADHSAQVGLDVRVGLGTSTTLSATLNPDFGQVEQDASVLNLSIFETFYPEKRPFFLEDSRIFDTGFPQFRPFHSRRIGRSPGRLALKSGDTVIERPDQTTILGAAKLTGRRNRWVYGGLGAITAPEYALVEPGRTDAAPAGAPTRLERLIEPRTLYSVGRVRRDSRNGQSNLGAIATAVVRDGDADAFTGGPDFALRWDRNRGSLTGMLLGTDAPFGSVRRQGLAAASNFGYFRKHAGVSAHYDYVSPSFRNADIGFLGGRVNKTNVNYGVNVGQPDPRGPFRSVFAFAGSSQSWNNERVFFDKAFWTGGNVQFRNFSTVFFQVIRQLARLDDLDTRGGPPILRPAILGLFGGFNSDSRKTWRLSLSASRFRDAAGGSEGNIEPSAQLQISGRLQASLSGSFQWGREAAQWIANTDATGDGVTDYVYGRLERHVVSLTGRATYAFSRDMTLEAYLQPFVAVGDYTDIRRLARPRTFEFEPVTLSTNPDFNTKSLRSNIVFRWEYKRGSTLFVVWNTSTLDAARPGVFAAGRDLRDAFAAPGTHVLLVKLNYWMGL